MDQARSVDPLLRETFEESLFVPGFNVLKLLNSVNPLALIRKHFPRQRK